MGAAGVPEEELAVFPARNEHVFVFGEGDAFHRARVARQLHERLQLDMGGVGLALGSDYPITQRKDKRSSSRFDGPRYPRG